MKGKTKRILVIVVKWRHRANGLFDIFLCFSRPKAQVQISLGTSFFFLLLLFFSLKPLFSFSINFVSIRWLNFQVVKHKNDIQTQSAVQLSNIGLNLFSLLIDILDVHLNLFNHENDFVNLFLGELDWNYNLITKYHSLKKVHTTIINQQLGDRAAIEIQNLALDRVRPLVYKLWH